MIERCGRPVSTTLIGAMALLGAIGSLTHLLP
jgi:hypothetical protein